MNRKFNKIWHFGGFIVQVMLSNFYETVAIRLVPSITVARSNRMVWVIGLDWIFGDVNFGWMQKGFKEMERKRLETVANYAEKLKITPKQAQLRFREW